MPPRAAIFAPAGAVLSTREKSFFAEADPAGFILFARNCESPDQIRRLTAELRACVGRGDAPILIDQEGGPVARLKPPHWPARPAAPRFGGLARRDMSDAIEAAELNARLIADDLHALGLNVDCIPLLDVPAPNAHDIIAGRAFDTDPGIVVKLGQAVCRGLSAGGVAPVIKHMPGQGRATADSHERLPVVDAPRAELDEVDFAAFRALRGAPWGMTAHVVYRGIDETGPATTSSIVIGDIIRGAIGFDGVLLSDDLGMKALGGDFGERAAKCLAAGCDIVLHCSGDDAEMRAVADAVDVLSGPAAVRFERAIAASGSPRPFDRAAADKRLAALLDE
ncbi:MAG: beta-N-acetylhexosaminidase [Proteobacteria bacterium]|nr:beta-N-acetylhexosaminidase [Pseudomonadota bacterium]